MQWLASISVKRPVFATVLVLVFVVVGMLGYTRLEVDRFPKVDFPTVMVTTYLDGATPGEIETDVTDKIEEAVNTVSGIDELHSTSAEGLSQVMISFLLEKDADVECNSSMPLTVFTASSILSVTSVSISPGVAPSR